MSRIGNKVIPLPAGVKYKVDGNTVLVEGPKGKVSALIADGISLETKDGALHVNRESDKFAAVHGLTRALVFNAVHGDSSLKMTRLNRASVKRSLRGVHCSDKLCFGL